MVFSLFLGRRNTARRTTHSNRVDKKRKHTKRLRLERLENRSLLAGFPIGLGGTGNDSSWSVEIDTYKNVFVAGTFANTVDFDPAPNTAANLTSTGEVDGFLAKYSPTGDLLWARRFGGASSEYVRSIKIDPSGNAYLGGSFTGTTRITGPGGYDAGISLTSHKYVNRKQQTTSLQDALVVKFDANGGVAWAKQFGGDSAISSAFAHSVEIHTNELGSVDVYVTGTFGGTVDFNPEPTAINNLISAGSDDAFVVKLDVTGARVWAMRAGSQNLDNGNGIAVAADGSAYVTGAFSGSNPFGAAFPLTSKGGMDGFVAKLNPRDGTLNWVQGMGGGSNDIGNRIIATAGSVYVTGSFQTAAGGAFFPTSQTTTTLTGLGYSDGFVSKLDVNGTFLWTKQIGGQGFETARVGAIDALNNIYITGYFGSTVDFDPSLSGTHSLTAVGSDAYVVQLGSDGQFGWATQLRGPGNDNALDVTLDPSSNTVFATGSFFGSLVASRGGTDFGPTLTVNGSSADVFVVKLDARTGLLPPPSSLLAAAPAPMAVSESLSLSQVSPIFEAALAKWQATGADVSSLFTTDIRVADLGGSLLGLASGNTITLDDNAAGWGWFIDSTPSDDSEFRGADNQGEMHRMDLLSVLMHEIGHLLGHDHEDDGLMAETLAAGIRRIEAEQVDIATTDLAFGQSLDFEDEFPFAKAKRRK